MTWIDASRMLSNGSSCVVVVHGVLINGIDMIGCRRSGVREARGLACFHAAQLRTSAAGPYARRYVA